MMYQFRNLLIIILYFIACSGETRKYEYIEKNHAFRNTIKTGYFIQLNKGFTYCEYDKLNNDELIVFIHGFSVPAYIWDETYYEAIKRGFGVLRLDLFGRGYSDNPDVAYTDELFSNQVVELLDKLNITKKQKKIIIDDEADYATPNAKINKNTRTAINKTIHKMINDELH